jgi:uncharacterized protein YraI
MKTFKLASAALMLSMASALAAHAAPGYSTADVNIRSGPDTDFPSVGVIREGDGVDVRGCLNDESWCDVIWDGNRGWVFSEYLAFDYRGEVTSLPDVGLSAFRIPIVAFAANDYWKRYYVGRPFYKERDRWVKFKPRRRVGWKKPPSGPRKAGWWRSGYQAPSGMKAPPDRGWKRPDRPGRGGPDQAGPRRDGPGRDGPGRDGPGRDRSGQDRR